jgi:hypothetical protein
MGPVDFNGMTLMVFEDNLLLRTLALILAFDTEQGMVFHVA